MEQKPYYEQEYREPDTDVPEPSFGQIVKELFLAPFKWNARSTRKGFWVSYAVTIVVALILAGVSGFAFADGNVEYTENTFEALANSPLWTLVVQGIVGILMIWLFLGELAFTVRRLHDSNHSGWWYWITVVPFGWLVLLYFLVLPTLEEPVRWGGYLFMDEK